MALEKRGAAHKSRAHRPLRDYKQADSWNVLALSNGRWKLPDDQCLLGALRVGLATLQFGAGGQEVGVLFVHHGRGQERDQGRECGEPDGGAKGGSAALKPVVKETRMLFEHRDRANFHELCLDIIVDSRTAVRICEK